MTHLNSRDEREGARRLLVVLSRIMAAPAGSRLRLVCSNCTTLCEVSIPASATQKPVRYQVRCPNCKTVNDPQIARTTNGVAEVVGPNSSAKRKASPTVHA